MKQSVRDFGRDLGKALAHVQWQQGTQVAQLVKDFLIGEKVLANLEEKALFADEISRGALPPK